MQTKAVTAVDLHHAATLAAACLAAGIRDAAELAPLVQYAEASEQHRDALERYWKTRSAHARFAAHHDNDDPGHEDHQRNLIVARAALTAAEQLMIERRQALAVARGQGGFARETQKGRASA